VKHVYNPQNEQAAAGKFVDVHTLLPFKNYGLDSQSSEKFLS